MVCPEITSDFLRDASDLVLLCLTRKERAQRLLDTCNVSKLVYLKSPRTSYSESQRKLCSLKTHTRTRSKEHHAPVITVVIIIAATAILLIITVITVIIIRRIIVVTVMIVITIAVAVGGGGAAAAAAGGGVVVVVVVAVILAITRRIVFTCDGILRMLWVTDLFVCNWRRTDDSGLKL